MLEVNTSYPENIQRIHKDFLTASDRLLDEAKGILAHKPKDIEEKANRLKALGFTNAKEAKILDNFQESTKDSLQVANIIERYSVRYPNYKFITEDEVKKICKKYNLTMAPIDRFTGFVPETKLKELEKFNNQVEIRKEDIKPLKYKVKSFSFKHSDSSRISKFKSLYPNGIIENNDRNLNKFGSSIQVCGADVQTYDLLDTTSLQICAPKKDLDLKGLFKTSLGYFSFSSFTAPKDPVVLKPVNFGFLVVCAWGPEASDELVVNQKMN